MDTNRLKKFAQSARRKLLEQVKARLNFVLSSDTPELREKQKQLDEIRREIKVFGEKIFIDRIAYIWFNRFTALRFMDANNYTDVKIVSSPVEGFTQPEILDQAKKGIIDDKLQLNRDKISKLLTGKINVQNPQNDAYKILLIASCNSLYDLMPFMFEKLDDYTELLMPDDLLSEKSIISDFMRLDKDDISQVESIGWLYQFYISEKKDEVFEGLKKNKKIEKADIPAATQLFTPHWIVRYLVENSLGRLWMLNSPNSRLREYMEYYIEPDKEEIDFLRISSPEEIRFCDPASGSGHILVYGFDLMARIYEELLYDKKDIPKLILEKNLYGIEIDPRAGALSAFALTMKAREYDRRFFKRAVTPNICILKNVEFSDEEMSSYMKQVGEDLFTLDLRKTMLQFSEADNFGSLIVPALKNPKASLENLKGRVPEGDLFLHTTHEKVMNVIEQADYLSQKYHVVVANPPYMGGKGMNARLSTWAKDTYPESKSDLFAMFIERNLNLVIKKGSVGMITMQSWMFLSSFEKLRISILDKHTILSMAHLGARAFDSIGGEVVSTTAFVLENAHHPDYKGAYIRLVDGNSEEEKNETLKRVINEKGGQ